LVNKNLIIKDILSYSASTYIAQAIGMISSIWVASKLGPENFGIYNAILLVLSYAAYSELGVLSAMGRDLPIYLGQNDTRNAMAIEGAARFSTTFGAISASIIIFFIYLIIEKKISINSIIVIFIFILISIFKMSATLVCGLLLSSIVLLLFEHKRISFLLSAVLLFLSFILIYIFSQDVICLQKINPKFNNFNIIDKEKTIQKNFFNLVDKTFDTNFIKTDKNKINKTYKVDNRILDNINGSTTSLVFFHALNITLESFLKKPFGWGFQRYEDAFFEYNKKNPDLLFDQVYKFHSQDGTNNLFKIMTEFGIFGFIIYLILAYSLISKKISTENKFFLFPFLITQSLRGAGYFNGGFVLILFILLVLQFKKKNVSSLIS